MIAIVYARVSTEDQAKHGYSLQDQIARCTEKAEQLGATTVIKCVDEGVSGDVLERPGLARARTLIRAGDVTHFICYDPDRLARKLSHQLLITDEIERTGCKLIFVNFDWKNTPEGRLFYSLRGAIAEYEKEKIKERSMRGLRQKAKQGGLTHNPRLYGYRYNSETNSLDIEPAEAKIVQQMYRWFAYEQVGYSTIATRLTEMGIPTRRGAKEWATQTVRRILTNETYNGTLYLQRYNTVGVKSNPYLPKEARVKRSERPRDEWVPVEVPQIIDDRLFAAAQRQAARVNRIFRTRTFHGDYLLSGLLTCGLCGTAMSGCRAHGRRYYRCNVKGHLDTSACDLPYFRAEALEKPVWQQVRTWVKRPELLCEALQRQNASPASTIDVQALESKLADALKEQERLLDLVQRGAVTPDTVEERLRAITERTTKLRAALQETKPRQENDPPRLRDIADAMRRIEHRLDTMPFAERQQLVRCLILAVIVTPDELHIKGKSPV